MPWNSPKYKPENKICDEFWHDFISAAKLLLILDNGMPKREKEIRGWKEPTVYSVFDKLRQDYFDELPFNERTTLIQEIDRSIERDVKKELKMYG